jgi:hypothetical protein
MQPNYHAELTAYINYRAGKVGDSLTWWPNVGKEFPNVARVAKKYLAIPAANAPSERVFSTGKVIVTRKKWALDPNRLEAYIKMRHNMCILEAATKRRQKRKMAASK